MNTRVTVTKSKLEPLKTCTFSWKEVEKHPGLFCVVPTRRFYNSFFLSNGGGSILYFNTTSWSTYIEEAHGPTWSNESFVLSNAVLNVRLENYS
ncbi:hypothetical protein LCGC14_0901820 [marine sediment metagenome]|uniref:Uncharacterized protein n=1 Tax=marine sediment metagenome TaxID=412755 RepID=A0A0F9S337_9ZZZZ